MQDAAADRTCRALSPLRDVLAALYISRCTFVAALPSPVHTLPIVFKTVLDLFQKPVLLQNDFMQLG